MECWHFAIGSSYRVRLLSDSVLLTGTCTVPLPYSSSTLNQRLYTPYISPPQHAILSHWCYCFSPTPGLLILPCRSTTLGLSLYRKAGRPDRFWSRRRRLLSQSIQPQVRISFLSSQDRATDTRDQHQAHHCAHSILCYQ